MKIKYFVILTAFSGLLISQNNNPNVFFNGPGYHWFHKYKGDCAHVIAAKYLDLDYKTSKDAYKMETLTEEKMRNWQQNRGHDWEDYYILDQWNKCMATRENFKDLFKEKTDKYGYKYKECDEFKIKDCEKYFDRDVKAVIKFLKKKKDREIWLSLKWENNPIYFWNN